MNATARNPKAQAEDIIVDHAAELKAKQAVERKQAIAAAKATPAPKSAASSKAVKVTPANVAKTTPAKAAPKATVKAAPAKKQATVRKVDPESKAARVRAAFEQGMSLTQAAKSTSVDPAYVWDLAAVWERQTGKRVPRNADLVKAAAKVATPKAATKKTPVAKAAPVKATRALKVVK